MNNEMTPELLTHLTPEQREAWDRCQKATPGPWTSPTDWSHYAIAADAFRVVSSANQNNARNFTGRDFYGIARGEDANFIAHARQDLPSALLELALRGRDKADAGRVLDTMYPKPEAPESVVAEYATCPSCEGAGNVGFSSFESHCATCDGAGRAQ